MEEILNKILENLEQTNIVITGQNMSGKSRLLLELLKKREEKNIYFISCNNRTINEEKMNNIERLDEKLDLDIKKILKNRIKNLEEGIDKDILGRGDTELISEKMNELFLREYLNDIDFKKIFDEFIKKFGVELRVKKDEEVKKVFIRGIYRDKEVNISTGIKALVRLFIELWFAYKNNIREVYIDEVDLHIDQKNSIYLLENLFKNFYKMKFVSVIHNMSVISGLKDTLILEINEEKILMYDSNEYTDLRAIAQDIYKIKNIEKHVEKTELEKLMTKIYETGKIENEDIELYNLLKNEKNLSLADKDILDILKEIIEDDFTTP